MSAEKEEYIESAVSLEGKYPKFQLAGAEEEDIVLRFEPVGQHRMVNATSVTDDLGGDLELHFATDSNKLAALRFAGAAKRWKLERLVVQNFETDFSTPFSEADPDHYMI